MQYIIQLREQGADMPGALMPGADMPGALMAPFPNILGYSLACIIYG